MRVPNLLVNGAEGIAVGMATSIPPHNLGEVIDAVKAYIKNDSITTKQLMKYIKGPDFPTGGIVVNKDDLINIYETGQGKIKVRGKVETEELKGGKKQLVISDNGVIDGNLVYVYSQDAAVLNGAIGEMHAKKIANIYDMAMKSFYFQLTF